MQHHIELETLPAQGEKMAGAISSCVHCGFCLPSCPTYVTLGEEMDSPRGRIFLMKEVLEGSLELEAALPFIDNCLGCRACETACPSGVPYGELITPFRAYAEDRRERPPLERAQRWVVHRTLPHPRRFRVAARLGSRMRRLMPRRLRSMVDLLPETLPEPRPLPKWFPARGERRARVALLAGCVQQVLAPEINWATLRVLAANGVETVVVEGCCGALAMHAGEASVAKRLARRRLRAFPEDVDAVITNAAGCGSGMREYPLLFADAGEGDEAAARALADRVVDVSVFLAGLGLVKPPPLELKVAYHDACHLAHAQGVRREPRELLRAVEGVTLVEPAEWEMCCGSAGTYNLEHPDIAAELGQRKADTLRATGADVVVSANIGCLTQLASHGVQVLHLMQLLERAYGTAKGV